MLSKMHYAAELAAKGHNVYFVNPPRQSAHKDDVYINDSIATAHYYNKYKTRKAGAFAKA